MRTKSASKIITRNPETLSRSYAEKLIRAGWLLVVVFAPIAVVACSTTRSQVGAASAPASGAMDAAESVQKQVDAYNSQDLDGFLATYADDATIVSAGTGQVVFLTTATRLRLSGSPRPRRLCSRPPRQPRNDRDPWERSG